MTVGEIRKEMKISQHTLARAIGVAQGTIFRWEKLGMTLADIKAHHANKIRMLRGERTQEAEPCR